MPRLVLMGLLLATLAACPQARAQQAQNPSPMVEHTREHPRLAETRPPGRREALELGTLFVPARREAKSGRTGTVPLLVVFHGGSWLPEVAGHEASAAVIGIQLGAGSAGYGAAVSEARLFPALIGEAEHRTGLRFHPVTLAGWSAGCGALRELLRQPGSFSSCTPRSSPGLSPARRRPPTGSSGGSACAAAPSPAGVPWARCS